MGRRKGAMDPALPQSPAMRIKQHMQNCPSAWEMLLDSPLPPSPPPRQMPSPFQHRLSPYQPRIANSYPAGAIGAVGAIGAFGPFNPVSPFQHRHDSAHQMDFTSPGKVHIAGRLSQLREATMQTGHEWQTIQQRHANEWMCTARSHPTTYLTQPELTVKRRPRESRAD